MRVVEDANVFADVFFHDLLHAFGKWAGIADRCAFGDAGCENNGVGAETDEISGAQHGFLPGTAAAVDEADDVERFVGRNVGENAAAFADGFEIQHAWAIISGLIATDDADFHK